jgi:hypothetical protein
MSPCQKESHTTYALRLKFYGRIVDAVTEDSPHTQPHCLTKTSSISVIVVYERVLVDATTMVVGSHQPCISVELLAGQFDGRFGEVLTK